jgi:thiamine-phosphate diphosphorylase
VITEARAELGRTHQQVAGAALSGGARLIQLREKRLGDRKLLEVARELRLITREAGAALIINDRLDIALASRADGVHLGPDDLPVAAARKLAGEELIIGASVSNLEEAQAAAEAGATYLGVGSVYATGTKADAGAPVGLEPVREIKKAVSLPVLAIGGITAANAAEVIGAGADGVAVVTAVSEAEDMAAATRELLAAVDRARQHRLGRE